MKKVFIILIVVGGVVLIAGGIIFYLIYSATPTLSNPSSIGLTNTSSPVFSFDSSKAGAISYSGDCVSSTISATKGSNTVAFESLSEGNHSNCQISVANSEGKQSSPLNVPSFTIDITKPVTTANSNNYTNGNFSQSVTINLACTDSGSGCNGNPHYKINGGSEQQGSFSIFNTNGIYSLEYWSVDNAGNEETHHTEFNNIKIDLGVTPSPSITTSAGYRNQSFDLDYTPTNSNDNCYYSVDASSPIAYGQCTGTFSSITLSGESQHGILVYENDSVGHTGSSNAIVITWDTTSPEVTITSPSSGDYNSTTWPGVVLYNYDDAATCQYSSDESSWNNFNSCSDTSNYQPSSGTLYVRGIDAAGNVGNDVSVTFTYQN